MSNTLELTVIDPEHVAWKGRAKGLVLGINDGLYGILPGHAESVMLASPSILKIETEDKTETFFLSGGCVKITSGCVTVLANSTEAKETIDVERARKSAQRARERLESISHEVDYVRARASLQRALTRLKFVNASES
jgi:F-type H+-transporting ATPase subunit epsilon